MTTPHPRINRSALFTKWVTAFFAATAVSLLMGSVASAQVSVTATAGTVGPTPYTTVGGAFTAINAGTHQGAITISITANTTETGAAVLNSSGAGSALYTSILMRPTTDGVVIAGPTVTGRGLIELNGADNVTIDGDNPNTTGTNRNLTITNTAANTITFTMCIRVALAATIVTSADNNTFKNLILNGSGTGKNTSAFTSTSGAENTTYGIYASGGASTVSATTAPSAIASTTTVIASGATANNLTIQNNSITTAARAVAVQGSATTVFPGLLIENNTIGNATVGAVDGVYSFGVTAQGSTNAIIRGNTVNVESFLATSIRGLDAGSISATGSGFTFEKNKVNRVINSSTAGQGAYGINVAAGNNFIVRNNFVQGVINVPNATFSTTFGAHGIRIATGTGHLIYHNSVSMTGNLTGSTGTALSSALCLVTTASTGMDVRNNILYNTQTETGAATPASSAFVSLFLPSGATVSMNLTENNNDYFTGGAVNNGVGQAGATAGTNFFTLANFDPTTTTPASNMRAYTSPLSAANTNDNASKKVDPIFVSATDLHIQSSSPMESMGANVGVTDDVDGDARGGTPDIGADEITLAGPGTLQFSSATYTGAEGTSATITVSRAGGVTGAVSVDYATSAGTATAGTCGAAGVDYQDASGTLNWANGDSANKTFSVTICSDAVSPESTETVTLTLSNAVGTTITGTNPATLNITDVPPPLSGNYNVGPGQTYTTLTAAVSALNTAGVSGPVTFTLTGASYTTPAETFPITINAITGASATNTITIKPNTSVTPTISGTTTTCIINLLGSDFITIDGSNAAGGTSRDLTITNINAGTSSAVVCLTTTISPGLGATNDVVKNTNIIGNSNVSTLFGIFSGSSTISTTSLGTANNSNTFRNNNISKTQYGIYSGGASAANKNTGNVITQNAINTASTNNVALGGILVSFEEGVSITENNIANINNSSTAAFGISLGLKATNSYTVFAGNESTGATISRNKIDNIVRTGDSTSYGIGVSAVTSVGANPNTIVNNFVSGVRTTAATPSDFPAGILLGGGSTGSSKVHFNSVSMTGVCSNSSPCFAIAVLGTNPVVDLRDNIFSNIATSTSGKIYAIGFAYGSPYSNLTSNSNDFYTGGGANLAVVGGLGNSPTGDRTFATFQTETNQDDASKNVDPLFISATTDLHLQGSSTLLGMGMVGTGVTEDIDGETRDNPPDIGADEIVNIVAPGVLQFSSTTYTGNEGTTATITVTRSMGTTGSVTVQYATSDGAGAVGGGACGAGIDYVSASGTLTFPDTVASQTFMVSLCSDAVLDPSETVNLTLSNATGGASIGANNPATLTITDVPPPLSGVYNVPGDFASLTNTSGIFERLNSSGASGNVTINIAGDLTGETGSVALNQLTAGITVTIKPTGQARSVTSTASASSLIRLSGADNVTIDGSLSGGTDQSLTLINTNTASGTTVVRIDSLGVAAGATNDTIKNTVIQAGTNFSTVTTSVTFGIFVGNTSGAAAGPDNDNLTIQNNLIQRAATGIQVVGDPTGLLDGLVIQDNTVGGAAAADYIGRSGIVFGQATGASVIRNTVRNVVSSAANDVFGITVSTGTVNSSVTRNTVSGMDETNTGGYGATGITVSTAAASSGITVANNFVYDIKGTSYLLSVLGDTVVGIRITGTNTGGINVYDNSVNLFGDYAGFNGASITAAFMVNATTPTALDVRGNIFVNSINNTTVTTDKNYAIYTTSANTTFTDIDYNDYYTPTSTSTGPGTLAAINSIDALTLPALQTATGKDLNSKNVDPLFTTSTNLHLTMSSPVLNMGIPLTGVTSDFDGEARSATRPDIGADEVYPVSVDLSNLTVNPGTLTPSFAPATTSYTVSVSNSTTSITVTPTAADPNSLITVNGTPTTSGSGTSVNLLVGDNTITVVVTGEFGSPSKTYTIVVTRRATQTITFGPLADKTYGDPDFTVSASSSSGLPVSFAAIGQCTVSGSTVHITGAGSCTITASQAGNNTYDPAADVMQAFNIARKAATVTANSGQSKVKGTADPTFTYTASGLVGADTLSGALARTSGESPGSSYSITQGTINDANNANYTITFVGANFVITGPIAANDAASRPANSEFIKIPLSTLLSNDTRIATDGSTQTNNLSVQSVTNGTGNSVSICGAFVCYTPTTASASDPLTFTYTVTDGGGVTSIDTGTVTVTTTAAQPFSIQILGRTQAVYDSGSNTTSIMVEFLSSPNQNLIMEYSTDMSTWVTYPLTAVSTGPTGDFVVTFVGPGNTAATWNANLFFRATRQ